MEDYDNKSMEERIIESYKRDEEMMILVFAQWCVNNKLDPHALYLQAYPQQEGNQALANALALTVSEEEAASSPMIRCLAYSPSIATMILPMWLQRLSS